MKMNMKIKKHSLTISKFALQHIVVVSAFPAHKVLRLNKFP